LTVWKKVRKTPPEPLGRNERYDSSVWRKNCSIFLDRETNTLFGHIEIESEEKWSKSADTAICRKWWDFMADIMETNKDNSPPFQST
jgi:L-rhamnose mutarotase